MAELTIPPPLQAPIEGFVGQCAPLLSGKGGSTSAKFIELLTCSQEQVTLNARGLLTNLAQFPENKEAFHSQNLVSHLVMAVKNPQMQLGAIAGLATVVADHPGNQHQVYQTDFLSILSSSFSSWTGDSKEQSLRILMHLARHQEDNNALVRDWSLLQIFSRPKYLSLTFYVGQE